MSKTIDGVPEYLTRAQLTELLATFGVDAGSVSEPRIEPRGVHVTVLARDEDGRLHFLGPGRGFAKHQVHIPVRHHSGDERTTTVSTPAID